MTSSNLVRISTLFLTLLGAFYSSITLASKNYRTIWDSKIIETELLQRQAKLDEQTLKKIDEINLYISKNDLKAASAVLTLLKAKITKRNDDLNYIDAYLDFRFGRIDSALRNLSKITPHESPIQIKKCFLWLKISWDNQRWNEVNRAFNQCESTLAHYSLDELFYSKNLYNFSVNTINQDNVSPSPFFYFYSPDYQKIEQWLSLLIQQNYEKIAIKHLQRIPDESLNKGHVRLLTAMALWNAGDLQGAQSLTEQMPEQQKEDWKYLRLMTSMALNQSNWQLAWDTNLKVLDQKPHLSSARFMEFLLGWQMNLVELIKSKHLQDKELLRTDVEFTPIAASMLYLKGLRQEAQNLLKLFPPYLGATEHYQLTYWIVKQWISLRNNQMATFMNDAVDSCQKKISFGCWMLISGQVQKNLDKAVIFPYDSVGEYFREQL